MREISNATDEQSRGIEQIALAVSQMDALAQQNASLVEQSAAATRSLQSQSDNLIASMAVFQLEEALTALPGEQDMETQSVAA